MGWSALRGHPESRDFPFAARLNWRSPTITHPPPTWQALDGQNSKRLDGKDCAYAGWRRDHTGIDTKRFAELSSGFDLPTQGLGSGRVPHVRPSVHPDFLSSSLALTNFMRLSLMKAAHAPVGGAPCRKSGPMGRKWIFQMLSLHRRRFVLLAAVFLPA